MNPVYKFLTLLILAGLLQILVGSMVIPFNFDHSESDMGPAKCVEWHRETVVTAQHWVIGMGLVEIVLALGAIATVRVPE